MLMQKLNNIHLTDKQNSQDQPIIINIKWCKGCDICIAFCPKNVLGKSEKGKAQVIHGGNCNKCGICEMMCPDLAIEVLHKVKKPN